MPSLSEQQQEALKAREPRECPECFQVVRQNYCRQEDVFFEDGHKATCSTMAEGVPYNNNHNGHRTY